MEWIRVEERLPPQDGKPFLGYDPSKEEEGQIYVISFVKGRKSLTGELEKLSSEDHYLEASGEGYFQWQPTYWMPLPEVPKE